MQGKYTFTDMSDYDEDYYNAEDQAYIEIGNNGEGKFHFGHVRGYLHGRLEKGNFAFTWEGSDENDRAFGRGWLEKENETNFSGMIVFHERGEYCEFSAMKIT